jgi:uracil-DNA glycosylase family 4
MTKIVKGFGPTPTEIMLIGEAPGANEEIEGKPFVGSSGQVLDAALEEAGLDRDSLFITNIYKHRPPNNRTPNDREIAEHLHFLMEEFNEVDPTFVLLLGNTPLRTFTGEGMITKRHGMRVLPNLGFEHSDIFFYTTFHPAATLYNGGTKEAFFNDIRTFAKIALGTYM